MANALSSRARSTASALDIPWRFAPRGDYHPESNPAGLISFATAENTLMTKDVQNFIDENAQKALSVNDLLYRGSKGGGPHFPGALARHLNEFLQPHEPMHADMIRCVGSATAMHDILAWALADPGDAILTSRPAYGRFELDFGNKSQVRVVYADTEPGECFGEEVVAKYEEALAKAEAAGITVRMLLLVNPHNPLGRCYSRSTLSSILRFCHKHNLHILSDEIYACSVFDPQDDDGDAATDQPAPFTSVLALRSQENPLDHNLIHVTYGLSKDFAAPGLRLGAIISRNKPLLRAIDTAALRFSNPSGPSLALATAMLEDRAWCRQFLALSRSRLAAAHRHVTQGLRSMGVQYLRNANACFFVWIDLSPSLSTDDLGDEANAEDALARRLLDAGVFLHPREEHSLKPGWFRLVYTQDPAVVTEGLKRQVGRLTFHSTP